MWPENAVKPGIREETDSNGLLLTLQHNKEEWIHYMRSSRGESDIAIFINKNLLWPHTVIRTFWHINKIFRY
jgi:hypothetical protein